MSEGGRERGREEEREGEGGERREGEVSKRSKESTPSSVVS